MNEKHEALLKEHADLRLEHLKLFSGDLDIGEEIYYQLIEAREDGVDMIVCPMHMGDTIWIAAMTGEYIRQHDCNSVCLVVPESQVDLVRQFPDVTATIAIPGAAMSSLSKYMIVYRLWSENHIVYAHFKASIQLKNGFFVRVDTSIFNGATMLEDRMDALGLTGEVGMSRMRPVGDKNNSELKELLGNAILLFPVSQSMGGVPKEFWVKLANEYISIGYDVFTNYNEFEYEYIIDGTRPLSSTMMELAEMAEYFAGIVTVRSGASDLIAETDANLAIVYNTRIDEKRVELTRNDRIIENIYDLVDRDGISNFQYVEGMEEKLVKAITDAIPAKKN